MRDFNIRYLANETEHAEDDKVLFLANIGWLLSQTREGVYGVSYDAESGDAVIEYDDGSQRTVSISGDSYCQMVVDIIRRV